MTLLPLLIVIAIFGFAVWIILQISMPAIVKNIIIGVATLFVVIFLLQQFNIPTGLPAVKLW